MSTSSPVLNGQLDLSAVEVSTRLLELIQSLSQDVVSFRREVADLRREYADLWRQNLELRREAGYWKSRQADAVVRRAKLERKAEQLRGENR